MKYNVIFLALNLPREELYNRINLRVNKMFDMGLEKEITKLINNNEVNFSCQSMQAIGYKEFKDYFDKKISIEEVKELIAKNSRNYAKRQITFIKGFNNVEWFNPLTEKEKIFNYVKKELLKNNG